MEQERRSTKELLSRFYPYLKKYRRILFLDLFAAALTTICELVLPLILRYLTNLGVQDVGLITAGLLIRLGVLYLALRCVDIFANYYMANMGHVMGAKIETDMRRDVFAHLQNLSDTFYNNNEVGKIMARITNDLNDITEFAHHCPEEYFIGFIKLLIVFIVLIRINVLLTMILFIMIGLMILFASKYNSSMRRAFKAQRVQIGSLNANIEDSLSGIRVVKSFANEDVEKEKFDKGNQDFLTIKEKTYRYMAEFHTVTRIFDGLMYLTVIMLGGYQMMHGRIDPGDLVIYALYVTTLLATVRRIVEFTESFQRGMTGIERFVEIMDADVDIFDSSDAKELKDVQGEIIFDDVTFAYPDDGNLVLEDLDLVIPTGGNVALVGPSGSGKTTLCNLIPRFYDVTSGRILIDGIDVKDLTLKSLRDNIGMVQQDVYLFSGTVLENIEYGKPGATKEEVIGAAKLAGAYDFITQLPQGFNTYVGERGVKLSGGQKQRISIARVFLKNPPILILDEATSALDNESEQIVQRSLKQLAEGRTTLTIAHRLSTIRNADTILVLTEEGLVEKGSHDELMEKQGVYYELYLTGNLDLQEESE